MIDLRSRLNALASNLWWSWHHDLDRIFRQVDVDLWRRVQHNPIAFLHEVPEDILAAKGQEAGLIAQVLHLERKLEDYIGTRMTWATRMAPGLAAKPVAYFSPEFCIHESLPIYSGGLGVLAGDHLKSCSDLGLPTYGVCLLYRQGYFQQELDRDGTQVEVYQELDLERTPIRPFISPKGGPLSVTLAIDSEQVTLPIWEARVGRTILLLVDVVDQQRNSQAFPQTMRLYGGDLTTRILQELALGVGGYRALRAAGIHPGVLHLNEGHSAFAVLEAVAERMEETGQAFHEALPYVAEKVVFTTHTPVPAGHDRFPPDLALHFLRPLQQRLHLSDHELLGLGRVDPHDPNEEFCMTVLALRTSTRANAVSALHGFVSRRMWNCLWPEREVSEVPLGHVTNGVHLDTWLARELRPIYQETLGNDWEKRLCEPECWAGFEEVDRHLLWTTKLALKMKLFRNIEYRHRNRNERLGLDEPVPALDPEALTIGFARRFATYKRATLLFEDFDRALRLFSDPRRPVQLVVAGKAHPADEPGQALLRRLFELARDDRLRNRLVVVENYDKGLTRHLLAGVDLWLNVPRRPMEACGTSGMKAIYNATLNCSTLDGWWNEAYDTRNGFAVGEGLLHVDPTVQDRRDAASLLDVLEQEVVPSYYDDREAGIPRDWLDRVVRALVSLGPLYHSERMVRDYVEGMYLQASKTLTSRFVTGS